MPSQKRMTSELNKIESELKDLKIIMNDILSIIKNHDEKIKSINNTLKYSLEKKEYDLKDYINIEHDTF